MKFLILLAIILTAGCADLNQINRDLNNTTAQLLGTFTAPVLSASPRSSGCSNDSCKELDEFERAAYAAVDQKRITYSKLVELFYEARRRLYPSSNDPQWVYEYRSFQRALAEHVDAGKMSSTQWEYLIDKKFGEIIERRRTKRTVCNTSNVGTSTFPEYTTVCRQ